jgi:glutamyl endopeptidase
MISSDTVSTAGHCVNDGGGRWSTNVRAYPGRKRTKSPYGSCSAKTLYAVSGWVNGGDNDYDYGAIKLNCTIGNTTGWFGMTTSQAIGGPARLQGYPAAFASGNAWPQYYSDGLITNFSTYFTSYDGMCTWAGESGGGIYQSLSTGPYIVALHTDATANGCGGSHWGTRITSSVLSNLDSWSHA